MDTRLACRELLKKNFKGEVTRQEIHQECAYMLLQFLSSFKFIPYPEKPQDVLDYIDRKQRNPEYKASNEFWKLPHIAQYLYEHKAVRTVNCSHLFALKCIRYGLLKEDTINLKKVNDLINEYPDNYLDISHLVYIEKPVHREVEHATTTGNEIRKFEY